MRVCAVSLGVLLVLSEHKYDRSIRISRTEPTEGSAEWKVDKATRTSK
jgi:hypothetical protein